MIKVYDSNYEFLKLLSSFQNLHITETLSTGLKTLCFQVPIQDEYLELIQEENYIETSDYSYVIKEIILEDDNFITVYCSANIEQLTSRPFGIFDCFEKNLPQAYNYCLSNTDWKIEYNSENLSIVTYQLPRVTGYEMIELIAADYNQELWFDTKNKTLKIYDRLGKDFGAFYSNELKIKSLNKQSSSYDYVTVVHPIGKNGLEISAINNNRNVLENFSYSNKHIEKYYIDEDITVAEILKEKAQRYLDENCMPKASYKLQLSDLGEETQLGDTILLVDKLKRIKQKQRVVKIVRYPQEPEKSTIEISNLQIDFARDFVKQQKKIYKEINNIKKQLTDITENS